MEQRKLLLLINLIIFCIGLDLLVYRNFKQRTPEPIQYIPIEREPEDEPEREPERKPINYDITTPIPSYMTYENTVSQLKKWHEQAPELTEINVYGKSSKGHDLYYIRINNHRIEREKPVVLIHANTHGNEPCAGCVVMAYIGTILDKYGDDEKITKLVDSRDLYFVPIVSPDSRPYSREVDGVDPNRDWPTQRSPNKQSCAPIQALRDLFMAIKPNAMISGHTAGQIFVYPWGDSRRLTPNDGDYRRILGEMSRISGYGIRQACYVYGHPIYGTEMDWGQRNGALSIVIEFGTHYYDTARRPPNDAEIESSFHRTFPAVLHFIVCLSER